MTNGRDLDDDMHRWPIDDGTADRLLAGRLDPKDAPPGYEGVARLVRAARGPALPHELSQEAPIAAALAAASAPGPAPAGPPRSKELTVRKKLVPFKLAAASAVGVIGFATAAAAVGVDLASHSSRPGSHATVQFSSSSHPATNDTAGTIGGSSGGSGSGTGSTAGSAGITSTPVGPTNGLTNGHATFGLCTAFLAIYRTGAGATSSALTSTAFKALATFLKTTSASATATACATVVKSTKPGASSSSVSGATPASHPSPPTHFSATTHPGA